jgi:hypothetical protein
MAETGWPLIPREVLPAPIPAARGGAHRRSIPGVSVPHSDLGRQLSIFGAETTEPSPADLAGLLAGPGRLDRMGGTARVSVDVDAAWRVHVLVKDLVSRGLVISWHPIHPDSATTENPPSKPPDDTAHKRPKSNTPPDWHTPETDAVDAAQVAGAGGATGTAEDSAAVDAGGSGAGGSRGGGVAVFEVRTAYSSRLNGLARSWPAAADRLFLSGPRLRLWVSAAGVPRAGGYALGLDPGKDPGIVDAALVRAGLAGTVSDGGRCYLILGRKRLARLAELVGQRPTEAPAALWPGGAPA